MTAEPALSVRDLRVAGRAGDRITTALEAACSWLAMDGRAGKELLEDAQPDLVLIEASDGRPPDDEQVMELASHAQEAGIPMALWLTGVAETRGLDALGVDFDAVFSADPGLLLDHGLGDVIGLPHAACASALAAPASTGERIGIVLEPDTPWDQRLSSALGPILDGAAREGPLALLACEPVAPGLPPEIMSASEAPLAENGHVSFISSCGVIFAAIPPGASRLYMPAVAFDAVAMGVPVIVGAQTSAGFTLPRLVAQLGRGRSVEDLISASLAQGEFEPGRRDAGISAVRNEHTYSHRLATIASTLSLPVMPDPWRGYHG